MKTALANLPSVQGGKITQNASSDPSETGADCDWKDILNEVLASADEIEAKETLGNIQVDEETMTKLLQIIEDEEFADFVDQLLAEVAEQMDWDVPENGFIELQTNLAERLAMLVLHMEDAHQSGGADQLNPDANTSELTELVSATPRQESAAISLQEKEGTYGKIVRTIEKLLDMSYPSDSTDYNPHNDDDANKLFHKLVDVIEDILSFENVEDKTEAQAKMNYPDEIKAIAKQIKASIAGVKVQKEDGAKFKATPEQVTVKVIGKDGEVEEISAKQLAQKANLHVEESENTSKFHESQERIRARIGSSNAEGASTLTNGAHRENLQINKNHFVSSTELDLLSSIKKQEAKLASAERTSLRLQMRDIDGEALTLRLRGGEDRLSGRLQVQNPQLLRDLSQNLDKLKNDLHELGFEHVDLQFTSHEQNSGRENHWPEKMPEHGAVFTGQRSDSAEKKVIEGNESRATLNLLA